MSSIIAAVKTSLFIRMGYPRAAPDDDQTNIRCVMPTEIHMLEFDPAIRIGNLVPMVEGSPCSGDLPV